MGDVKDVLDGVPNCLLIIPALQSNVINHHFTSDCRWELFGLVVSPGHSIAAIALQDQLVLYVPYKLVGTLMQCLIIHPNFIQPTSPILFKSMIGSPNDQVLVIICGSIK